MLDQLHPHYLVIMASSVVLVDDENSTPVRSFRQAPPVASEIGHSRHSGAAFETETSGFVNGHSENDHADEYSMQTATPTKPSHS